jgi:glycosyltransferase involved in cell wall biosynthesis
MDNKQLSIILLSYNDSRIERAIRSIRHFDDIEAVKIVVIDGGSTEDIQQLIRNNLSAVDTFISEPDKGIFDALNKGLDKCNTEYIGWLGSDDMFTGKVPASHVIRALGKSDLLIANLWFHTNGYVTRMTPSLPSRFRLAKYGLHNPHFATFGTSALLKSERFRLDQPHAADQEYFIKLFNKSPRLVTLNVVATLQEEGGFSNRSITNLLRANREAISIYAQYTNWFMGFAAGIMKLGFKLVSKAYYRVFRVRVQDSSS